ncbi:MAG: mechanosensitive ion channel family protein [Acidiferrobacterales bacterium]
MNVLESNFFGNEVQAWVVALAIMTVMFFALQIGKAVLVGRLSAIAEKTETKLDDIAVDLLRRTKHFFVLFAAIYAGSLFVTLPQKPTDLVTKAFAIALLAQVAIWGNALIAHLITAFVKARLETDAASVTTITVIGFIARVAIWSAFGLLVLENIGFDISALLAGLGIGGIAAALALQNVLGDLFASIAIVLDKPFVVGDFIIIGEFMGTVEQVGIKTTRVRSLSGEQLVFSNNDLLNSRIRNYKRMFERRIVFALGVVYQTPPDKLESIPIMLREIIESQENTRFDRAHFKSYGDFALNFEIVYYVKTPQYNTYMDIQQAVNLTIYRRFQETGIEFAYPTQTLFLEKG